MSRAPIADVPAIAFVQSRVELQAMCGLPAVSQASPRKKISTPTDTKLPWPALTVMLMLSVLPPRAGWHVDWGKHHTLRCVLDICLRLSSCDGRPVPGLPPRLRAVRQVLLPKMRYLPTKSKGLWLGGLALAPAVALGVVYLGETPAPEKIIRQAMFEPLVPPTRLREPGSLYTVEDDHSYSKVCDPDPEHLKRVIKESDSLDHRLERLTKGQSA